MDRSRTGSPVHSRQWSATSTSTGSSSPAMSPLHPDGVSAVRRTQNVAAKAAAQRLAQVMASQTAEDDDDDDLGFQFGETPLLLSNISRRRPSTNYTSPSPAVNCYPPLSLFCSIQFSLYPKSKTSPVQARLELDCKMI